MARDRVQPQWHKYFRPAAGWNDWRLPQRQGAATAAVCRMQWRQRSRGGHLLPAGERRRRELALSAALPQSARRVKGSPSHPIRVARRHTDHTVSNVSNATNMCRACVWGKRRSPGSTIPHMPQGNPRPQQQPVRRSLRPTLLYERRRWLVLCKSPCEAEPQPPSTSCPRTQA
jgi:hypothetical protein